LEVFNQSSEVIKNDWVAFAEVDKIDMVITYHDHHSYQRLTVEFKYHFTFDMARRLQRQFETNMQIFPSETGMLNVNQIIANYRGERDLRNIILDCLPKNDEETACDVFILIIQDRYKVRATPGNESGKRHEEMRGVKLHFLHEQISLQSNCLSNDREYTDQWAVPISQMIKLIYDNRPFTKLDTVSHFLGEKNKIPLTSHFIGLNFTSGAEGVRNFV